MRVVNHLTWISLSGVLLALGLSGCSEPEAVEIVTSRPLPPEQQAPILTASIDQRFRGSMSIPSSPAMPMAQPSMPARNWAFQIPAGWEQTQKEMREVSFTFGAEKKGECYVARLMGGSVKDNVNRWRSQMGLPASEQEEISKLPTRHLLGQDAVFVALDGAYRGPNDPVAANDYRMVGLILINQEESVFIKMVGPKAEVEANEDEFATFCESLRIES